MAFESISFAYRDGGSDKVYHAQIEKSEGGFVVNFQYGRRGQTLQTGTKTNAPVGYEQAKKVYDKLVKEKQGKGYTTSDDGTPYAGTEKAGRVSGLVPQLLNPIEENTAETLIGDDLWFMQEKKDGVRMGVRVENGVVTASNRKGLIVPISSVIETRLKEVPLKNFVVDGEAIGDVFWMFDMLEIDGLDIRGDAAINRWLQLWVYFGNYDKEYSSVRIVKGYETSGVKRAAYDMLREERAEGVVFKRKASPYVSGRPNSGGNQLKFKFKASATVQVIQPNGTKRSVEVGVGAVGDPAWIVSVGNVTIPPNYDVPHTGDLVEVEYLYAYPGGSLYQPVYKGLRSDKSSADINNTLKFKQGTTEDDDA